ncbi:MAG TPA: mannosyltransferase family protein [Solirubrobacteraceae bacterium]|nr:mannosyltransferase family protein [Solirubrobacteraceae bacterium]
METAPEQLEPFEDFSGSGEAEPVAVAATPAGLDGASEEPIAEPPVAGSGAVALTAAGAGTLPAAGTGTLPAPGAVALPGAVRARRRPAARVRPRLSVEGRRELLWICVIYVAAHVALLTAAFIQSRFGNAPFQNELANWDGMWYRELANKGYPAYVSYGQTTLGFFPLFPLTIWPLEHVFLLIFPTQPQLSATLAGALISSIGGLIATVLVHRLAEGWWDRETARRATVLFVLFPGSVVFTMVYSEGVMLPLVAGCLYALERRRWLLAGVLAGFATAVQPVALAIGPVCLVAALLEIRRLGPRREALRSLVAPALSVSGAAAFMGYLWAHTGSPFANYLAQHHGWSESTSVFALWHDATKLAREISFSHFDTPTIDLNLPVGLIGAVILTVLLVLVWRARRELSAPAIAWSAAVAFFAYTSSMVPPNPRMLLTAFPALVCAARYVRGGWFEALAWINGVLLVGLSLLTFFGLTLRP